MAKNFLMFAENHPTFVRVVVIDATSAPCVEGIYETALPNPKAAVLSLVGATYPGATVTVTTQARAMALLY